MSGEGSLLPRVLPNERPRLALTAFLFGCLGTAIALSRVGKDSGAHINPAVTVGFWMMRKLNAPAAVGDMLAQLLGAALGALPLLAWGSIGRSVAFGATIPGQSYSTAAVVLGAGRIEVAKLYHFDSDRRRLFRRMGAALLNAPAARPHSWVVMPPR